MATLLSRGIPFINIDALSGDHRYSSGSARARESREARRLGLSRMEAEPGHCKWRLYGQGFNLRHPTNVTE